MWRCHKCNKPVYFAERRQSLGFDWHPWCLKCAECGKVLNPGQHAEHKSTPYCYIPCYSALFGPKLFGHGSTVESHQSFGQRSVSFVREQKSMQRKIEEYNAYVEKQEGARMGITHREVNSRLVLEGVLRVFWGVDHSIRLREFDDKRLIAKVGGRRDRKCMSLGFEGIEFDEVFKRSLSREDDSSQSDEDDAFPSFVENNSPTKKENASTKTVSELADSLSQCKVVSHDDIKAEVVDSDGEEEEKVILRRGKKYQSLPGRMRKSPCTARPDFARKLHRLSDDLGIDLSHMSDPGNTFPSKDLATPFPGLADKAKPSEDIPLDLLAAKDTMRRMYEDCRGRRGDENESNG